MNSPTNPDIRQQHARRLAQAEADVRSTCAGGGASSGSSVNAQNRERSKCATLQDAYKGYLQQARNASATPAQRQHAEQEANQLRPRVAHCGR